MHRTERDEEEPSDCEAWSHAGLECAGRVPQALPVSGSYRDMTSPT